MAQLQLPQIDANALRERVRDIDLSRLADLGDELRRLDIADTVKGLDLRALDIDAVRHLDLDALRHLGDGVERPELDLGPILDSPIVRRVQRALGREPKRSLWSSITAPSLGSTMFAGVVVVLVGAAVGGVVAWLFQPGKGDARRARIRRRVRRLVRKVTGAPRPA